MDKLRHIYCNWQRRRGSTERVNRRKTRRTKRRRSIGPQRGTGSSMPVSTTWPLPALGIPNPVITQNTQGLTGSLSQCHFPLGSSGLCGMCVSARTFCRVDRFSLEPRKHLSCTCHLDSTSLSATTVVFTQKQKIIHTC